MKKKYLHFAIVAASLLLATSAFSTPVVVGGTDGTDIGGAMFRTSTGVILMANIIPATGYGAASKHTSGDTVYSYTSADPTIDAVKTPDSIGTELPEGIVPAAPAAPAAPADPVT